jgi:hypothetical protein
MKFIIASLYSLFTLQCLLRKRQTQVVIKQLHVLFQRILWRHHQPYLVKIALGKECLAQCNVSVVNGIEGTAKDADDGASPNPSEGGG